MGKYKLHIFALLILSISNSCGDSGGTISTLAFPSSLEMEPSLQTLVSDLGDGENSTAITTSANIAMDIINLGDQFFSLMRETTITTEANRKTIQTSKGTLKIDFSALSTVNVDIDMDGMMESITCSEKATIPYCAYLWIDNVPFAVLVMNEEASDTDLGNGIVVFHPSEIDAASAGASLSITWDGSRGDDGTRTMASSFTGPIDSDTDASTGSFYMRFDEGMNTVKESALWAAHPLSCEQTQMAMKWESAGSYISTGFAQDSACTIPVGTVCTTISTGDESVTADKCDSITVSESDALTIPTTTTGAELPSNFPSEPSF